MHMSEQDTELYVSERLPPDEMSMVESRLSAWGVCRRQLSESVATLSRPADSVESQKGSERRKEERIGTDEAGSVQSIAPFTNDRLEVQILDVSQGGMKLRALKPLDPGMMIKIRLKNVVAFGEVRYCNAARKGFNIGIKIENVFP